MHHVLPPSGTPILLPATAMLLLGWTNGQRITQPQIQDAINAKAALAGQNASPITPSPTPLQGQSLLYVFFLLLALFVSFGGLLILRQDGAIGGALMVMAVGIYGLGTLWRKS